MLQLSAIVVLLVLSGSAPTVALTTGTAPVKVRAVVAGLTYTSRN